MVYRGSKNRLMKELKPLIEDFITDDISVYVEPFVGGGNSIDKIDFDKKVGYDNHIELIALLNQLKSNPSALPAEISFEAYSKVRANPSLYPRWYVGAVGFGASYGGRYFDGGYGRNSDKSSVYPTRRKNMVAQSSGLQGISFEYVASYQNIVFPDGEKALIYCDPPYRDTKKYSTSLNFDHEAFYQWCREKRAEGHIVLVSEYWMPSDFIQVWAKDVNMLLKSTRKEAEARTERLFVLK